MANSFTISINAVFPLFSWMLLGYLARKPLGMDEDWLSVANGVLYNILFSITLFLSMYDSNLNAGMGSEIIRVLGFVAIGIIVSFVIYFLAGRHFIHNRDLCGSYIVGITKPNSALYSIAIALALYGDGSIAMLALVSVAVIPLYNVLCVFCLEYFRGGTVNYKHMGKELITNPTIVSVFLGLLAKVIHLPIPGPIHSASVSLSQCTTPVAFILLGAGFSFASVQKHARLITSATIVKLVIAPVISVAAALLLGFQGQSLATVFVIFSAPSAVTTYSLVCAVGGDQNLSNEIIVFTSIFSLITVFIGIFILKANGLI